MLILSTRFTQFNGIFTVLENKIEKVIRVTYRSLMIPNPLAPTNFPIDKATCTVLRRAVRSQTKSH